MEGKESGEELRRGGEKTIARINCTAKEIYFQKQQQKKPMFSTIKKIKRKGSKKEIRKRKEGRKRRMKEGREEGRRCSGCGSQLKSHF